MGKLPDCDEVFRKFFDPWYSGEDRERKGVEATRPDMLEAPELLGKPAAKICALNKKGQKTVLRQIEGMIKATQNDWKEFLKVTDPMDLRWIGEFDEYANEERVRELMDESDPKDFSNKFLIITCEFGAVIGHVMRKERASLEWLPDWPYWESAIFDSRTGSIIPVFHWAIKKMSNYGIDDGFVAKTKACLKLLDEKAGKL